MRLRSCIGVEVALGSGLLCAAAVALLGLIGWVKDRAQAEAIAAPSALGAPLLIEENGALDTVPPVGLFLGVSDDVLLAPLLTGNIESIKYNRGGSSISLRIDFDNGARAAFKPNQLIEHTVPRREVAAFRINRMLGLSSVPPAVGRKLPLRQLIGKVRRGSRGFVSRMREEMEVDKAGMVAGELSWWIPVIKVATMHRYDIDSVDGIVTWTRYLTIGQPIAHSDAILTRQVSDLIVFDFVIDNVDRWSGSNVRMSEDGRVLYFMDNTASFGTGRPGRGRTRAYLHKVQKFSRSLVASLEALTEERVRAALTPVGDAFQQLLSDDEIAAVIARRDFALEYLDQLISIHGREAVMVFP